MGSLCDCSCKVCRVRAVGLEQPVAPTYRRILIVLTPGTLCHNANEPACENVFRQTTSLQSLKPPEALRPTPEVLTPNP